LGPLALDGAAAANHNARQRHHHQERRTGNDQPAFNPCPEQVLLQRRGVLVKFRNRNDTSRIGLANGAVNLQQRLAPLPFMGILLIAQTLEFGRDLPRPGSG